MGFLRVKTAREMAKSVEEFEALSTDDQAWNLAFTRVNMKMAAWEADEQQRDWERKRHR
jgi:hypothetical protein